MKDWRSRLGIALGLGFAAALAAVQSLRASRGEGPLPPHGTLVAECEGALEEIVIQYVPESAEIVGPVYRDFLRQLPATVSVGVVCPDEAAFADLRARVGPMACRLLPIPVGHAMTCWSRDRWLAFAPEPPGGPVLLLAPGEELGAEVWPARQGDARIAADLAAALPGRVAAHRSVLVFDGGDFAADAETVFVTPAVRERNLGRTVASVEQLARALAAAFRRRIVLLPDAPPHHAGMFMMVAGDRTVIVGDPSLAERIMDGYSVSSPFPIADPDFSPETQRRFDAVAATCAAAGYRVVRMPVVLARDGRTYLTGCNAIIDRREGKRIVYMPTYREADALNRATAAVWRGLGYEVRRVDCTAVYPHGGSLHCLVNVLRRSNQGSL